MFTVTQVSSELVEIVAPSASLCYDKVSSRPLNVPPTITLTRLSMHVLNILYFSIVVLSMSGH